MSLLGVLLMGSMCPENVDDSKAKSGTDICIDRDGDGYGVGGNCLGKDCDVNDPDIYPGAPELCDEIDNQCSGDAGYGQVDEGGVCSIQPPMALIPAGCFNMGDAFSEGGCSDELPVHHVCITFSFRMDVHEATNLEYQACVDDGGCTPPSHSSSYSRGSYYGNPTYGHFPVVYVDWSQAVAYCAWAGKRLPTEAEWEYAARGGLVGKRFPWGDTITGSQANYWDSGDPWDNDTSAVGYYAPNGYGLYDVEGNLWEWVNDRYSGSYYQDCLDNAIVDDPAGPDAGVTRVVRGGGFSVDPAGVRTAKRLNYSPTDTGSVIGFRCAGD